MRLHVNPYFQQLFKQLAFIILKFLLIVRYIFRFAYIKMDQKGNKTYLPNNYQQFLMQRKKTVKQMSSLKLNTLQQPFKQNKMNKNFVKTQQEEDDNNDNNDEHKKKNVIIVQKILHSDYKKMFQDFQNNKFESISNKINSQLNKLKVSPPINIPSVSDILNNLQIQSLENINIIREEFKAPIGKRNIEKLENMLSFNKFFIILNKQKRWKIFDNAFFQQFEAGQKVYQEGEEDKFMYVIIKGCVKQYQKKKTSFNEQIMVNFTSYYQGSNFGEVQGYSQNQIKGKRYSTIETTQKCYVLKIANNFYRELISNSAEDDFEKKLNSLMQSSIFKQTSKMMVTPLMSTLQKHIVPYGNVLIRQGQEVHKLYFVADGNLKVLFLDRSKRSIKHLNIQQKPQIFLVGRSKVPEKSKSKTKTKSFSIHNTFYYPQTDDSSKQFIYGKKKLVGDQIEYNDQVVFCQLRMGDFFGGKSFLSHVDKQKKQEKSEYFDSSLKAKLSIICSSTKSLVYSIDEKKFFSLSQNLQKLIIKGIMDEAYFDEYNIQQKLNLQRNWKDYSQKLVENIIKSKKQKAYSFRK